MAAKQLALVAFCLALAVMTGCSASPQQAPQAQVESNPSSATATDHADGTTSSAAAAGEAEPAGSSGSSIATTEGTGKSALEENSAIPDHIALEANGSKLSVALADTDAARALAVKLADGSLTLELSAYGGFEKVGPLGFSLPASNEQTTAQPGDVMLYQGNQITIFTGTNTWAYTRLGHIESANAAELAIILGDGDVVATFALTWSNA